VNIATKANGNKSKLRDKMVAIMGHYKSELEQAIDSSCIPEDEIKIAILLSSGVGIDKSCTSCGFPLHGSWWRLNRSANRILASCRLIRHENDPRVKFVLNSMTKAERKAWTLYVNGHTYQQIIRSTKTRKQTACALVASAKNRLTSKGLVDYVRAVESDRAAWSRSGGKLKNRGIAAIPLTDYERRT